MGPTAAPPKGTRLKAATLLESVLALGLLAGASSIAMVMHQRTLATSLSFARATAWSATERVVEAPDLAPFLTDAEVAPGITMHVEATALGKGVQEVHITCSKNDRTLLERRVLRNTE